MSYSVLVVDDEPIARLRIAKLMQEIDGYELVAEAENTQQALQYIQNQSIDICLLDIHMPGNTGLEFAEQLESLGEAPAIVFCTAYEEHALQAFGLNAIDYVLKPVRQSRLEQALEKARLMLVGKAQHEGADDSLIVPCGTDTLRLAWAHVLAFIAEDKYVTVRATTGSYLTTLTLKQLEETYPQRLLRIHRNALVALNKTSRLKRVSNGYVVEVEKLGEALVVSRRHVSAVRQKLKDYGVA